MPDTVLDTTKLSERVDKLQKRLLSKIIGQERAIKEIVRAYTPMTVNIQREGRPLGVFLFMGPTGVGKTETVRQFASTLLGNRNAFTRIDCTEFSESHESAKLLGSPPGYLGYTDVPRLAQSEIDKHQTKTEKTNILLFDEIEKGSSKLFDSIMTILGDGRLTLGNGKETDFSRTFIFLTTNLGSKQTRELMEGQGLGFPGTARVKTQVDDAIYRTSKEQVKKTFRTEFVNRLDRIVVFRSLSRDSLRKILKLELEDLQWRIWRSPWHGVDFGAGERVRDPRSIVFKLTDAAKDYLLDEGTSAIYGARELNRAVDRDIASPMATLIASKQVVSGDMVEIDKTESGLIFVKKEDQCRTKTNLPSQS
jgi:ATP-dependent Clp protease ATP-binding subunit ClpB